MAQAPNEREARRQYVRQRQIRVFSVTIAILAIAVLVSAVFLAHPFGLGIKSTAADQPNYGVTAPCPATDADGNQSTYIDHRAVVVNVYNATDSSGLAQAVGNALINRSFDVDTIGNYPKTLNRTTIFFGKGGINQAYTVASTFNDAILQMDNRDAASTTVDVAVGASFNNLRPAKNVPAAGAPIEAVEGCKAADSMTNLPQAPAAATTEGGSADSSGQAQ